MAYNSLTVGLPGNLISGSIEGGASWGSDALQGAIAIPSLPPITFNKWSGTGSQAGLVDLLHFGGDPFSGTLTSTTPGTTDTVDLDLQAAIDLFGTSKSYAEAVLLAVLNYSTTDGDELIIGGDASDPATNPWVAPFAAMTDPTLGRLTVGPAHVDPVTGRTIPGGQLLWSGSLSAFPVSGTSKVLRLFTDAASLPYRVLLAGRSAAS